jgi:hypothetical protein
MEFFSIETSRPGLLTSGADTVFTPICRWGRPHGQSAIRKPHLWQSWRIAAAAGLRREPRWRSRQDYHTLSLPCNWTAPIGVYGLIESCYQEASALGRGAHSEMTHIMEDVVRSFDASETISLAGRKEVASG